MKMGGWDVVQSQGIQPRSPLLGSNPNRSHSYSIRQELVIFPSPDVEDLRVARYLRICHQDFEVLE